MAALDSIIDGTEALNLNLRKTTKASDVCHNISNLCQTFVDFV